MPNHAGELWTILHAFGVVRTKYLSFVKHFCEYYGGWSPGKRGPYEPLVITGTRKSKIPALRKLLEPVLLRRLSKDVLDLPPLRFGGVTLSKPEKISPDLLTDLDLEVVEAQKRLLNVDDISAETLSLLSPSCSTLRRYLGLMKVDTVSELIASELESESYKKIVLFCCHQGVVVGLRDRLQNFSPVTLVGKDTAKTRDYNVKYFNHSPKCRVMLANVQAGGIAINLTSASQVLFVEQDWCPSVNAQALKRCHRIGQKESVLVRTVSISDSLDDRINEVLQNKMEDISLVLNNVNNEVEPKKL